MSRSWTDPITNVVMLSGLESSNFVKWHYRGDLSNHQSERLLSEFLHEYTHHWCFSSLVARAVTLLELRLHLFTETMPGGRSLWARDYAVASITQKFLRPLAEGAAQFAEFDMWNSGRWHQFGSPISAIELCFASPDGHLSEFSLSVMRKSEAMLGRKASLYLKAFEIEEGYLPGYIAIKRFHQLLCHKMPNLTQELFLSFFRHFIWNDAVLALIILNDNLDAPELAHKIVERLQQRFNTLIADSGIPAMIASYEARSMGKEQFIDHEIGIEPDILKRAVDQCNLYFNHTLSMLEENALEISDVIHIDQSILIDFVRGLPTMQRHVVVLREEVHIDVTGTQILMRSLVGDAFQLNVQVQRNSDENIVCGSHQLFAVISTFTSFLSFVLVSKGGACHVIYEITTPDHQVDYDGVFALVRSYGEHANISLSLRARFLTKGRDQFLQSPIMNAMSEHYTAEARKFYILLTIMHVQDAEERQFLSETILRSGLRTFFAGETRLLKLFACYSLLNNAYSDETELAGMTRVNYGIDDQDLDLDYDTQVRMLRKLLDKRGSGILLAKVGDHYLVRI